MATIDTYAIDFKVINGDQIEKLNKNVETFTKLLVGAGIVEFTHKILELAGAIGDLADATGLSINGIAKFREGLTLAGADGENASKMIAKFFQSIDEAALGGEKAQKELAKVGISLKDLGQLSEEDLLQKAIKNLADLDAGAQRTALGVSLFGKSFRSVDPKVLSDALASGDFTKVQEAVKKAAELEDNMKDGFYKIELAGIQALSTIGGLLEPFIGKIEEGRLSLEQAEKIIKTLGVAIGVAFGLSTIKSIAEFVLIMKELNIAQKANLIIQTGITALQGPKGWAMLAAGAVAATAAIYGINKALGETNDTMTNSPFDIGTGQGWDNQPKGPARTTQLYTDQEIQARNQALSTAKAQTLEQQKQAEEAQKYQRIINGTLTLQSDQAEMIRAKAELEKAANDQILALEKQITVEKSKGFMVMGQLKGVNDGVIGQYQKQIEQIKTNLEVSKKIKEEELNVLAIQKQMEIIRGETAKENTYATELDVLKDKLKLIGLIGDKLTVETKIQQWHEEFERKMTEFANQRLMLGDKATQAEINSIDIQRKAWIDYFEERKKLETEAMVRQKALQNDASLGAKQALFDITQSMTPFKNAQNAVNNMWSTMGNAIDNFVTTGKFSFSSLATSMIQDILKVELKAQASKIFSGVFGEGGVLSSIFSSIFGGGKASGGDVKSNTPYIVGEKGPELFMPKSSGTIIPNDKLGGMGGSVTNTYITNNISAIDSRSVAQMFAENRKSLLGTVQLAQKEMPYSNR